MLHSAIDHVRIDFRPACRLTAFAALALFAGFLCNAPALGQSASGSAARGSSAAPGPPPSSTPVNACTDFYQYSCESWMRNNPIPPDQPAWGIPNELVERNRGILRGLLEDASASSASRTPVDQKLGDFYASCMDDKEIERAGTSPLQPEMDRIAALGDKAALVGALAHLHSIGVPALFSFGSTQDAKDSTLEIAFADQGGLSLPDRDYYLKTDEHSVELRSKFEAHVAKMFELAGATAQRAAADAGAVIKIETALATASLDRVSRRDPNNTYHKMTTAEFFALDPSFAWPKYLEDAQTPAIDSLNVATPGFFRQLNGLLDSTSLDDFKSYLRWHLLHEAAPLLPAAFVQENFNFFRKTLTGAKELEPRWKRCVRLTDEELGFALGQKYVEKAFRPQAKEDMLRMVKAIEDAMADDIGQITWMTPETKKQALAKLRAVTNKIGYPDKWRDYSSVEIKRGDAIGNVLRAEIFETHRRIAKIGRPVDRTEWAMTPPTVNAYYQSQTNSINFPAGILQPPIYDPGRSAALNYGAIGSIIGHELTHGFDDQGRKFDPQGNLRDWWTKADAEAYEQRASCFVNEYSEFTAVDDVHVNGKLTLGENIADNGGFRLAYAAAMHTPGDPANAGSDGDGGRARKAFDGYAQVWCLNISEQLARMLAGIDPHSPDRDRVNGVVRNMPEFSSAFSCKAGQPMASENACRVW